MVRSRLSCLTRSPIRWLNSVGLLGGISLGDFAKSWDVLRTVRFIKDRLPVDATVMDIGAFSSEILPALCRVGFANLAGIDLNPRIKEMPYSDRIRYEVSDFMATPFPGESFGAVTAISVIEHGFDSIRLLREVSRLLRPGGYFVASFDYWPEKVDTNGIDFFNMSWTIFSEAEVLAFVEQARTYGLFPCGDIDLKSEDPTIRCAGKSYTFAWMALQKKQ